MTPDDTIYDCTHPTACLRDGACALCAAVQEVRDALTERDAALRLAEQAADDRDRWRAAEARQEGPWLAVEAARLDAAEARLDIAEAALADAVSAREMAESSVPAGVAVLDLAALRAHVERLLSYVQHVSPCARIVAPGMVNPGRPCTCGLTDARAATPAESLEEHDRGVAARALRWAMGACPVCGGSGSAPADVCPGCPDGDRDHVCPTEQRPCSQCGWLRERAAAIGGGEP